jgi:hypothetical protein
MIGVLAAGGAEAEKAFAEALCSQGILPGTSAFARCMVHDACGQAGIDVFPHSEARLRGAGATQVFASIAELPAVITGPRVRCAS